MMKTLLAGLFLALGAVPAAAQSTVEEHGNWTLIGARNTPWELHYNAAGARGTYMRIVCIEREPMIEARHPDLWPLGGMVAGRLQVDGQTALLEYQGGSASSGVFGRIWPQSETRAFMDAIRAGRPAAIVIPLRGGREYRLEVPAGEDRAPVAEFYRRCGW